LWFFFFFLLSPFHHNSDVITKRRIPENRVNLSPAGTTGARFLSPPSKDLQPARVITHTLFTPLSRKKKKNLIDWDGGDRNAKGAGNHLDKRKFG